MHFSNSKHRPISGIGLGLRSQHFSYIVEQKPPISWFEVLIDNYLNEKGPPLSYLKKIAEIYQIVFHGVGLSLGSTDSLNKDYLKKLKVVIKEFQPAYISDHLSWISLNNRYVHQLLPLPYTEETLHHVVEKIQQVQDYLGQRIVIENVSSYLNYKVSAMTEWEFLNNVSEMADCEILLDINNIYVSSKNQNFNADIYLKHLNPEKIRQFHLAGYEDHGNYLLDTHNAAITQSVWDLYKTALQLFGPVPTLIEWDSKIPEFAILKAQVEKAQQQMTLHVAPLARASAIPMVIDIGLVSGCTSSASLFKIQQEFFHAITNFDKKNPSAFLDCIENSATLSAQQRVTIYQDSMVEGFITALQETFPVCQKLVGEEFFRAMAKKYIYQTPSISPDLGEYGQSFPDFITTFAPAQSLPYLADTALFEWYRCRILQGENNQPFNIQALAAIDENLQNQIIFQLPKNSYLIASKFPLARIWEVHQENYIGEFSVDFNISGESFLLYKIDSQIKIASLTTAQYNLLQIIQQEKKLGEFNEIQLSLLPQIVAQGWIGGVVLNDKKS